MHDAPRDAGPLAHATLHRGADRGPDIEALLAVGAERVGLGGVLADLDRTGQVATGRLNALTPVAYAFTWQAQDRASLRWWPQGITTSADAVAELDRDGDAEDPPVLITSAYAKTVRGVAQGSRISVVDLSDPARPRYRHVLLVDVRRDSARGGTGAPVLRPVRAHAGGIVWHGPWLHVAATGRGFWTFRLDDLLRVDPLPDRDRLGAGPEGIATFGHPYLLPVRFGHASRTAQGGEPLRFSFLSRSHGAGPAELLAGEYGHGAMSTRLWHYGLDPSTSLLAADPDGVIRPRLSTVAGVPRMQGAVVAQGRLHVPTSRGRLRRGSLWVERDGVLAERQYATPPGPEDVAYWPARDQLWSLSEHPHSRYVFALDRRRFD
jgi:hypothetical protein